MARPKTSKRKVLSVSLNPINPAEARVMEIIDAWAEQNVTLKDWVVDRMLRDDGATPERYAPALNADAIAASLAGSLEDMFHAFAVELIEAIGERAAGVPVSMPIDEVDEGEEAAEEFAAQFTNSFLARRRR